MPNVAETRRLLGIVRKRLKVLLDIKFGMSSSSTETNLMSAARKIVARLTAEEEVDWRAGVQPAWCTVDFARLAYTGDPAALTEPVERASEPSVRRLGARAADVYLHEHRPRLVAEHGTATWRSWGATEFAKLDGVARQDFMKKAAVPRTRARGDGGYWTHIGVKEDAVPLAIEVPSTPQKPSAQGLLALAAASDDGETPMKELMVRVSKSVGMGKRRLRRLMPISKLVWTGKEKLKKGRRVGFRVLSDARLKELVLPHVVESSRWSARTNAPLQTLSMSKRRLYMLLPAVHTKVGYDTFVRALRRGRLGIGMGSKRVDVCDYCHWFDTRLCKSIAPLLRTSRITIQRLDLEFFVAFDDMAKKHREYKLTSFIAAESPSYLRAFGGHLSLHGLTHMNEEIVAASTAALAKLNGTGADGAENEGYIEQLDSISAHWKLRDNQQVELRKCTDEPEADTLYLQWDFGDLGKEMGKQKNLGNCKGTI
jgi:hypothetical protein